MKPEIDILIPTIKSWLVMRPLADEIERYTMTPHQLVVTCQDGYSAAQNRNLALKVARCPIRIMLDDDICGFFAGWETALVRPLLDDPSIGVVSARLLRPDGSGRAGPNCADNYDLDTPLIWVNQRNDGYIGIPSACIAFRDNGILFDEEYVGSGWEDADFCCQVKVKYPDAKFVINNAVKLVHINEMKNQFGEINGRPRFERNASHFWKKWRR